MEQVGVAMLLHGEVIDPAVDLYARARIFIERHLEQLVRRSAGLRLVIGPITTKKAVDPVLSAPTTVAATLTPHHLMQNRNDMLLGVSGRITAPCPC